MLNMRYIEAIIVSPKETNFLMVKITFICSFATNKDVWNLGVIFDQRLTLSSYI